MDNNGINELLTEFAKIKHATQVEDMFTQKEIQEIVNSLPPLQQVTPSSQIRIFYTMIIEHTNFITSLLRYFFIPVALGIVCLIYMFNFINKNLYQKTIETTFVLYNPSAKVVQIAGDFTQWEPVSLQKKNGCWELKLHLRPGEYRYIYIIDGNLYLDPQRSVYEDQFGNKNSIIYI